MKVLFSARPDTFKEMSWLMPNKFLIDEKEGKELKSEEGSEEPCAYFGLCNTHSFLVPSEAYRILQKNKVTSSFSHSVFPLIPSCA